LTYIEYDQYNEELITTKFNCQAKLFTVDSEYMILEKLQSTIWRDIKYLSVTINNEHLWLVDNQPLQLYTSAAKELTLTNYSFVEDLIIYDVPHNEPVEIVVYNINILLSFHKLSSLISTNKLYSNLLKLYFP